MITLMTATILLAATFLLGAEEKPNPSPEVKAAVASAAGPAVAANTSFSIQSADSLPSAPAVSRLHRKTPKVELFLGYSRFGTVFTDTVAGNRIVGLNGGTASIAFNLNRFLGLVGDFGGFNDTRLQLTGAGANPPRVVDSSGTAFTYLFGPRLSFRKYERITPFAQTLFGGVHASEVTFSGCSGALCPPLPSQNSFAMTAGGGLDVKIQRHLAIRVIQAEYMMTRFADVTTNASRSQNNIRLSSGLVFRFGGALPYPPIAYSCAASPASVYPGEPITVSGTALNLNPKKTATYTWTTDGGKVSGTNNVANIDTSTAAPGSYSATGHVNEGAKPGQSADCSAAYSVMAFQPPTISCSASPSSVRSGEPATINAQATSPQNRPLTYSYAASGGSISGAGSTATLSTASAAPGDITVTCNVVDDKAQTASATATVSVQVPPPSPSPVTQKLCTISFERDTKRPTRVNNEAKACLDDIALNLQRSSDARIAVIGNLNSGEQSSGRRARLDAAQRAIHTRQYLIEDKGIDATRIAIYTGSDDSKTVDTILIPPGSQLDMTGLIVVDDSIKPIVRNSTPKKHDRQ
jgi:opacity protein-like surface antigen